MDAKPSEVRPQPITCGGVTKLLPQLTSVIFILRLDVYTQTLTGTPYVYLLDWRTFTMAEHRRSVSVSEAFIERTYVPRM